ncbi:MAG: hypothetical protein IOC90_17080 [Methylocystis sp.]|nr:hypothetical protein [Methylocystis sp.]MCA3589724.1 hypothetical protein [Methylocystis sp.]
MAFVKISDNSIWAKHVQDGEDIQRHILNLAENAPVALQIDGKILLFRKMKNGSDGRQTSGIRPDETSRDYWNKLYSERRGERVPIALLKAPAAEPYLQSIGHLLGEWDSPSDNAAYNDL